MPSQSLIALILAVLIFSAMVFAEDGSAPSTQHKKPIRLEVESTQRIEPLIQLFSSEAEPFQWRGNVETILQDYQESQEALAQSLIDSGQWARLISECRTTKAANTAVKKLDKAGLEVLPDGRIVRKKLHLTIVDINR